ncbi:predicted protein [Aspergillus nidulans FGSC A4]|uniref:Uncharacterized protein n=1 Tax=Emericella nidulans (strain FGSC A4 / ATCC 38163 / CBS 112.46 / NRRL 194 / M139) TaxID=227321 RepID=Q5AY29_EMENI|nr:hypothetical protein [Aspergillus nidulans FGSC A4]EAA58619.1 predicted protein [Aspergillus nidulans FGSC A4]CBF71486.1 TPA: conserved hypothetical protein [Aspergillus nidulans FGSC A4]|eukprot:XP_664405.1 predicted protein [Aspergillus nidulans FGSC A4]
MDTKMSYNGYSANPPPTWAQEPQYGQPHQAYQQPYQPYQEQYPAQPPAQYPPPHPGYSQSSTPAWGLNPKSYPRRLEVSFTSWSGRHMRVTEGTHEGPLVYAADLKTRRPHMLFQATGTACLPATVVFHNFSRTVDITINGEELPMRPTSHWKHSKGWTGMNLECVDENGVVFAKWMAHTGWSVKKSGRLEIYEPAAVGGKEMADELVVTGLANVYLLQIQTNSANAAAGSAAAVSA